MRRITFRSFAKFNPVLEVLGRDTEGGRHFVSTVIQNLNHYDIVTVEKTGDPIPINAAERDPRDWKDERHPELKIVLDEDTTRHLVEDDDRDLVPIEFAREIPLDMNNLAARAWAEISNARGLLLPACVRILKRIPFEAGLGGGSGNAAATLVGLARLFDLGIDSLELSVLGWEIGADVPFFLSGGMMLAEHFGERLTDLGDVPDFYALVIKPIKGLSTRESYEKLDEILEIEEGRSRSARSTKGFQRALVNGESLLPHFRNDFDVSTLKSMPETGRVYGWFHANRSDKVIVAGSGSAIVGIFESEPPIELLKSAMSELGSEIECAFLARPAPAGLEVVDWE